MARSRCSSMQRPSLRSFFRPFISLWLKIWRRNESEFSNWILCKAAHRNPQSVREKGVCSDSNQTQTNNTATSDGGAQRLGNDVWHDSESITTNVCSQIGNKWIEMFKGQHWQDKLQLLILRFFEQSAFVNNHLLCYWPFIHNLISKISPKFCSQFSLVWGWWAALWAFSKKCAKCKFCNSNLCAML